VWVRGDGRKDSREGGLLLLTMHILVGRPL
jgi:hypothetical protein